jgi:hypothetical protein
MTKRVLIVGETGSGKSTFINTVGNYFQGGNLDSPPETMHVLISTSSLGLTILVPGNHSERNRSDRTSAQTIDVQSYTWGDEDDITFIDTPGFGDTAGPEQDDLNLLKILDFAAKEENLAAVLILLNGTISRNTASSRTCWSRLSGNLPDIALNNVIFVITNCSDSSNCNVQLSSIPFHPRANVYMNNSAFFAHPRNWSSKSKRKIERDWTESMPSTEQLVDVICRMDSFGTTPFKTVLESRKVIQTTLKDSLISISALVAMENTSLITRRVLKEKWQTFSDIKVLHILKLNIAKKMLKMT